jgi:hypothetical protein
MRGAHVGLTVRSTTPPIPSFRDRVELGTEIQRGHRPSVAPLADHAHERNQAPRDGLRRTHSMSAISFAHRFCDAVRARLLLLP